MPQLDQSAVRNRLLKAMAPEAFALLRPHLRSMTTHLHQSMIRPNVPIDEMFFPETGFVSVTAQYAGGTVEVGLIGREGLVGAAPVLLGTDQTPQAFFVQASGDGLCIDKVEIDRACDQSPLLRMLLLRYIQTFLVQMAQTAIVNATSDIETRLARWLLMGQDRLDGPELALTHEFLAIMLGVQRTSVTLALQGLEGNGLIWARRGRIEVRDRGRLIAAAGGGYGVAEAEYARLIEAP